MLCPIAVLAKNPEGKFLFSDSSEWTYVDFHSFVNRVHTVIEKKNWPKSSRVLFRAKNDVLSLAKFFAIIRSGGIAVPINPQWPDKKVQQVLGRFDGKLLQDEFSNFEKGTEKITYDVDCEQPCLGILTSGSTGKPKLAIHSYRNLLSGAEAANKIIPIGNQDRTLLSLPLFHIAGVAQLCRALQSQSALVLGYSADDTDALNRMKVTHISVVGTQLRRMLKQNTDLHFIKAILFGGGPIDEELLQQATNKGFRLWRSYGLTESAALAIAENSRGQQYVLNGIEVKLSEKKELLLKGENLFLGYWSGNRLHSGRDELGFFHTGDRAEIENGKYKILGRMDNQFISGGKNIYPEAIERQLILLDEIEFAVVVPIPDKEFDKAPFAFIKRKENGPVTKSFVDETIKKLRECMPGYLIPRKYALLPLSTDLKPQRKELEQLALTLIYTHNE